MTPIITLAVAAIMAFAVGRATSKPKSTGITVYKAGRKTDYTSLDAAFATLRRKA